MQYVDRSRVLPPPSLVTDNIVKENLYDIGAFLALESQRRAQTRPPRLASLSKVEGLKDSLYELFNGRCAFCECNHHSLSIQRFRPSSNATPMGKNADAPLYYLWLAWAWQNFYLVCAQCNELMMRNFLVTGKRMPVPSSQEYQDYLRSESSLWPQWPPKEESLLLDPCQIKSFASHFDVRPQGEFNYLSRRGMATINILNLNDADLISRRAQRYSEYMKRLSESIEARSIDLLSSVLHFSRQEFGGSWYLLLRRLASHIDGEKGKALSMGKIKSFFQLMFQNPEQGSDHLYQAFEDLYALPRDERIEEMPSPPKGDLRRVQFQNFKSLEAVELELPAMPELENGKKPEARALLLLGENAAGKSTILEGIALALVSAEGRKRLNLRLRDFILSPALLAGDPRLAPHMAEVVLTQDNDASLTLTLKKGGSIVVTLNGQFNVGPVFAYGAFRQYRQGRRLYTTDKTVRNLFDGSLLGNPQSWLLSLSNVDFDRVVAALREVLSIEGEFDVIKRSPERKVCSIITAINGIETHTPLNVASSGFRTVLAMVCDIMQGLMDERVAPQFEGFENARGIVLIDEVEAHLHPRWKMQIMGGLRRALPGVTFIVTTHDPLCLRGMYNGEVRVMQRILHNDLRSESRASQRVETLTELPDITKLRVDQLLTSDFFQLDSTDEPRLDRLIAQVADLLAKREQGEDLTAEESEVIGTFECDIASAMPVGTSEAHRLVQEAVAEYLQERRQATATKIQALQDGTRSRILNILREVMQ
ncbi:AAA family ATPase [Escherichia coli]|nr:AAA family ATPase [Escherichia coli]EES4623563.1 AAA family ATPase [Escherichia coli]EES4777453.1 AAA family ATPase [Escherichia coli]EES5120679.1 AAA family ATPase [Escherichia coli]